jgi:hypothetical protein
MNRKRKQKRIRINLHSIMTWNISRMSPDQQRKKRFYGGKRGLSVQEIYSYMLLFKKTQGLKALHVISTERMLTLQWWQKTLTFNDTWLQQAQKIGYTAHVYWAWHLLRQKLNCLTALVIVCDKDETIDFKTALCVLCGCQWLKQFSLK